MLVKLLGLLDILSALILLLSNFHLIPTRIIMVFSLLMVSKGISFTFMGDKVSILDIIAGIYLGLQAYYLTNTIITIFFIIYLTQKGVLSLFAR